MIKTATLTGALLDYYVARAEGVPAEQLEIRQVQRSDKHHCVHIPHAFAAVVVDYYDWHQCGPLVAKHRPCLEPCWPDGGWYVRAKDKPCDGDQVYGTTPQEAICRAVVRAAFGDEVEDAPCQ